MADAIDQKTIIFDQADILGQIIPGAALLFGGSLLFAPQVLRTYSKVELGGLGVVILAALVAGQCLRVIAWTYFDKMRNKTPRRVFEDVFSRLEPRQQVAISDFVEAGNMITFGDERFLDLSTYAQIYALLRRSDRAEPVDRMERQFRLVSGLFVASVIVSVAYVLGFEYQWPKHHVSNWFAWGVLLLGVIALFFPAKYKDRLARAIDKYFARTYGRVPRLIRLTIGICLALLATAAAAFIVAAPLVTKIALLKQGVFLPVGLLALATFLYIGSIRFANAVASALLLGLSAEMKRSLLPSVE
jgi:hypothetical protein